jgi:TP901 family phage tail tape measure protein
MATTVRELITRWGVEVDDKQLKSLDAGIQKVKMAANIAGAALVAMFGLAVKGAADFDTAMGEVSTLLDASAHEMGTLNEEILAMSAEFGRLPTDTAKAFYQTVSAGFGDSAQAAIVMEGAMKLARGGVTQVDTAVDGLTTLLNGYGLSADQVTNVSDKMFVAMKAGKTTIGELSKSIGKVTPFAADAGASIDELLAATATLTLGGLKTSEAVSSLKQVFAAVAKPTKEAAEEAKRLGIDFTKAGLRSKGLAGFLKDLKKRTKGEDDAMAKLFGSVEGLGSVLALTGEQADTFNETLGNMENASGQTETAFQKMEKRAGATFDKMKAKAAVFLVKLGDKLLPMVNKIAGRIEHWVAKQGGINKVVDKFVGIVKILVALKLAFWLQGVATAVTAVFTAANAAGGFGAMALAMNPVLLVTLAIAVAFALILLNLELVQDAMLETIESFSELEITASAISPILAPLFEDLIPKVNRNKGRISSANAQGFLGTEHDPTLGGAPVPTSTGGTNIDNRTNVAIEIDATGASPEDIAGIGPDVKKELNAMFDERLSQVQAGLVGVKK